MSPRGKGNSIDIGSALSDGSTVRLSPAQRAEHLYVAGATNVGKSRFLESLIRQDITNWPESRSGVLLLDPHGSVYDGVMRWLASQHFMVERPIIPIDLRESDWVVGYNPLRQQPHVDPSVIVRDIVTSMAYAWGKANTNDTPRLERWTTATLHALYQRNLTLAEAGHILYPEFIRQREMLTKDLTNPTAASVWRQVRSAEKLEEAAESTVNRFQRFLGPKAMSTMLGQTGGLDLATVLEKGHIVLVSLATRYDLHPEDAKLFGTLLLADLWNTARRERDKRADPAPFYIYLDEFQEFVTPTIGRNLDQARGFGLHFTLANQYPRQVIHQGGQEFGEHLYDSLFQNTGNKVAFRLLHPPKDVEAFARTLFSGVFDPDQVKLRLTSPTVVGYSREMFSSSSESSSESSTESESENFDPEDPIEVIRGARSEGSQSASSRTSSEREGLVPELEERLSSVQFRSLDEQRDIAMAAIGAQDNRHGTGRFASGKEPIAFRSLETVDPHIHKGKVPRYRDRLLAACGIALKRADAEAVLSERQGQLVRDMEPTHDGPPRRRLTKE